VAHNGVRNRQNQQLETALGSILKARIIEAVECYECLLRDGARGWYDLRVNVLKMGDVAPDAFDLAVKDLCDENRLSLELDGDIIKLESIDQ